MHYHIIYNHDISRIYIIDLVLEYFIFSHQKG